MDKWSFNGIDATTPLVVNDIAPHLARLSEAASELAELTAYEYVPMPRTPWLEEGVTPGYFVVHDGPGPAKMLPVAALADSDGDVVLEPTGEWQDVTITPSA